MSAGAETQAADGELRRILAARREELVAFARALVATPSPNPPGDERAVAALVIEKLRELGVQRIRVTGAREERPNVLCEIGSGVRSVLLCGHLDTKPAGALEEWDFEPLAADVVDGELRGLGSGDMKGAVAAMVFAIGALVAVGELPGRVALVLTADEEAGAEYGARWLAAHGELEADAAVLGEPCGIAREWEAVDVVSRGAALFRVRVRGTQMHSSISDRLPSVNATVRMARLICRMDDELADWLRHPVPSTPELHPTVNVGVMAQAGVFYGVYPGAAEFGCDIRTVPGMTRESVEEDLRAFLADACAADPSLDAELVFEVFVPATEIEATHPLVTALRDASAQVLGVAAPVGVFPGATDAPHLQLGAGIPTVAAFGPGFLPRAHSPNETASVQGIVEAAEIYALAARRYLECA